MYYPNFGVHLHTGCSLNIVFFPIKVVIFLDSKSSAAAPVFDLPSGGPSVKSSVHTLTPKENQERPESGIFSKFSKKHNI